jgi:hypothetical protein
MAENGKADPPCGRPHVWTFAAVTLAASIGAAASIVAVQKDRYDDSRHDLEARIHTLEAEHAKELARIDTLTSQLATARGQRGKPDLGATPKGTPLPAAAAARLQGSADPRMQTIDD